METKMFVGGKIKQLEPPGQKEDPPRTFLAVASNECLDRDREVIKFDAWDLEDYRKNRVILFGHNYTGGGDSVPVIGQALWIKSDPHQKHLIFKGRIAREGASPLADTCWNLMEDQVLTSFSVGFEPISWQDFPNAKAHEPKRVYDQCKLIEISLVAIGSNPQALVQSLSKLPRSECVTKALGLLRHQQRKLVEIGREELTNMLVPLVKEANEELMGTILEEMREYAAVALRKAMGKAF